MRKITLCILCVFFFLSGFAQFSVYATFECGLDCIMKNEDALHPDQLPLISYGNNTARSATTAGATISQLGGVSFSPIVFSKNASLNSETLATFFYNNKVFTKITFYFYNSAKQLLFSQAVGAAYISGIQRTTAPCTSDCAGLIESYTIIYTKEINSLYDANTSTTATAGTGANAARNAPIPLSSYGYDVSKGIQIKSF